MCSGCSKEERGREEKEEVRRCRGGCSRRVKGVLNGKVFNERGCVPKGGECLFNKRREVLSNRKMGVQKKSGGSRVQTKEGGVLKKGWSIKKGVVVVLCSKRDGGCSKKKGSGGCAVFRNGWSLCRVQQGVVVLCSTGGRGRVVFNKGSW